MDKSRFSPQIDAFVQDLNQNAHDLSVSGVVVADGKSTLFGQADGIYPIASCTKAMTAWLAWTLAEEDLLDLDAPLAYLIPGLCFQDEQASLELTLRDALVHRSGLLPHTWAWVYLDVDRQTFFRKRLPYLGMAGPFRESYRYSNILYAAVGLACENATGVSWEELLKDGLWNSLGMQDTHHLTDDWHQQPRVIPGKNKNGEVVPFHAQTKHAMAPSGEVMSSAADMGKWIQFLLEHKDDHQALWQPDQFIGDETEGPLHYGLGWRIETVAGKQVAWHTGGCTGYSSLCLLIPEEDFGLCLLANGHGMASYLKESIFSILRGKSPWFGQPTPRGDSTSPSIFPKCVGLTASLPATSEKATLSQQTPFATTLRGRFTHLGYGSVEVTDEAVLINGFPAGVLSSDQLWLKDYGFAVPAEGALTLHYPDAPSPVVFEKH